MSPIIALVVARRTIMLGRLDEATSICDKIAKLEPDFAGNFLLRSLSFFLKKVKDKSLADLEAWHTIERDEFQYKVFLAWNYAWFGDIEKARQLIQEALKDGERSLVWADSIAIYYAIIGEGDDFFSWTNKAISVKSLSLDLLRYTPLCDKVKNDPRFPEIFKKLDLPY